MCFPIKQHWAAEELLSGMSGRSCELTKRCMLESTGNAALALGTDPRLWSLALRLDQIGYQVIDPKRLQESVRPDSQVVWCPLT